MIKFPESTKDFMGRQKKNAHFPSYTASPLSEYIGSQIYQSLGIPVHETMLGIRDNKLVVACKDFDPLSQAGRIWTDKKLIDRHRDRIGA